MADVLAKNTVVNARPIMWNEYLLGYENLKAMIDHKKVLCKVGDFRTIVINEKYALGYEV